MDLSTILPSLKEHSKGLLTRLSGRRGPFPVPTTGQEQVKAETELQNHGLLVYRRDRSTGAISVTLTNEGLKAAWELSFQ